MPRSGDVRYDKRTNEEVRLVKRLVSSEQGQSVWVVLYPDMEFKTVNDLRGKFSTTPNGTPKRIRDLSKAEWDSVVEEAEALQQDAPATMGIVGMSDYEDTGSEPDASSEGVVSWWWSIGAAVGAKVVSVQGLFLMLSSLVGLLASVFPEASKMVYKALKVVASTAYSSAKAVGGAVKALADLEREVVLGTVALLLLVALCCCVAAYLPGTVGRQPPPRSLKRSGVSSKRVEWPEPGGQQKPTSAEGAGDPMMVSMVTTLEQLAARMQKLETPAAAAEKPSADSGGGDLLASMRERLKAFRGIVEDDAGTAGGAEKQTAVSAAAAPTKEDSATSLIQRMQRLQRDPMELLSQHKCDPGGVKQEVAGVKSQVAPLYVTFIYSQKKRAVDYFHSYFTDRGLLEKPLYKEVRRLAGMLDDALFLDNADVRNSAAMERLCRRLYGVEIALEDVKSAKDLDDKKKCKWQLADQYDLTSLEGEMFRVVEVEDEVHKRLELRAKHNKYLSKGLDA